MFPFFIFVTYFLSLASLAVVLRGNKLKRKFWGSVWTQGKTLLLWRWRLLRGCSLHLQMLSKAVWLWAQVVCFSLAVWALGFDRVTATGPFQHQPFCDSLKPVRTENCDLQAKYFPLKEASQWKDSPFFIGLVRR